MRTTFPSHSHICMLRGSVIIRVDDILFAQCAGASAPTTPLINDQYIGARHIGHIGINSYRSPVTLLIYAPFMHINYARFTNLRNLALFNLAFSVYMPVSLNQYTNMLGVPFLVVLSRTSNTIPYGCGIVYFWISLSSPSNGSPILYALYVLVTRSPTLNFFFLMLMSV